ncbi:MAG: VOC family protein [Clostridiales bacterium]|nr:VOC family protein [Clostridiales bacterium]
MNQKIPGLGIAHLALKATDFEKSYRFYTEGLGMEPYLSWGEGDSHIQLLKFGGAGMLELFAGGSDEQAELGKYIHFAYSVEDVDKAYETALAAGAKPLTPPKSVDLDSEPRKTTIRIAFVYGPDNEQIEFFKEV